MNIKSIAEQALVRLKQYNNLKEKGYWSYGLVMNGTTKLADATFDTPTLFIVGNESVGIREKTLELCDIPLSIPMNPDFTCFF